MPRAAPAVASRTGGVGPCAAMSSLRPGPITKRLAAAVGARVERAKLAVVPRRRCDPRPLRRASEVSLPRIFSSAAVDEEWKDVERLVARHAIPDSTGGVNPGDRRAIYYLVRALEPGRVLEVGTHIGASTVHIALALREQREQDGSREAELVTVDLRDVNDPGARPWEAFGASLSPRELVAAVGCGGLVTFRAQPSLDYLRGCAGRFDLVFLDGSHSGRTVYQEIPAALGCLRDRGVVLLHDYYPGLRPLFSNGSVIDGPFLATERLRAEGADLAVVPLGDLPWQTKLGSRATSLALLLRR